MHVMFLDHTPTTLSSCNPYVRPKPNVCTCDVQEPSKHSMNTCRRRYLNFRNWGLFQFILKRIYNLISVKAN